MYARSRDIFLNYYILCLLELILLLLSPLRMKPFGCPLDAFDTPEMPSEALDAPCRVLMSPLDDLSNDVSGVTPGCLYPPKAGLPPGGGPGTGGRIKTTSSLCSKEYVTLFVLTKC